MRYFILYPNFGSEIDSKSNEFCHFMARFSHEKMCVFLNFLNRKEGNSQIVVSGDFFVELGRMCRGAIRG